MNSAHDQAEYTHRKFTNTDTLDKVLQDLAERHYQGNVSLTIRAAIENLRTSLDGTNTPEKAYHHLQQQIQGVQSDLSDDRVLLEEMHELLQSSQQSEGNRSARTTLTSEATEVHTLIIESERGLKFDDVVEASELPPAQVKDALERLVDLGNIGRTREQRYVPAGLINGSARGDI